MLVGFAAADDATTTNIDEMTEFANANVSVDYADLDAAVAAIEAAGYDLESGNKYIYYDEALT